MPSNHVVKAFLNDLNTAQPAPSDIVVWDVGANDGGWSNRLMQLLPERQGLSERQLRQFQKYALGCAGGLKPA